MTATELPEANTNTMYHRFISIDIKGKMGVSINGDTPKWMVTKETPPIN